ncbi:MAG: hypothetical protein JW995_12615 [Melioribacteraceae bacterium]|nr:hypothetical protein [Melioribacteraceae bacterium]
MEKIPKNVVIDLLPAYIAGEASEESRTLVEEFAKNDPQIARLIRIKTLQPEEMSSKISLPDDVEMKTIKRVRSSIRRQMLYVALVTTFILMAPLFAMIFTREVDWSLFDFIIMGILIFGTGSTYVFITRISESIAYRAAVGIAVVTGFFLIWINLAVGIIGSENNPANALYMGVFAAGIIGAGFSRLRSKGMAYTMYATAIVQMLVPVIAFFIWRPTLDNPPGIVGVFMLNAFFAMLFLVSALLFRRSEEDHKTV